MIDGKQDLVLMSQRRCRLWQVPPSLTKQMPASAERIHYLIDKRVSQLEAIANVSEQGVSACDRYRTRSLQRRRYPPPPK